ncbi:MAG: hypothetical protein WEB57_11070 [Pseudohongiellaceae bacterium]
MKQNPHFESHLTEQTRHSDEQLRKLDQIEQIAIAKYKGDASELESAIGMLRLGQQCGWRVMYLIHSKATIRKYEKILGISVKEVMPEEGPSAHRSIGYRISKKLGQFWKIVSGEEKVKDKRQLD